MTAKRKITDKNGVQVFPITHTKAVLDDNGNSVEQRMEEQMDVINQKQLEVGAVPSDIIPTEGSTNWVTSGGLYAITSSLRQDVDDVVNELNPSIRLSGWENGTLTTNHVYGNSTTRVITTAVVNFSNITFSVAAGYAVAIHEYNERFESVHDLTKTSWLKSSSWMTGEKNFILSTDTKTIAVLLSVDPTTSGTAITPSEGENLSINYTDAMGIDDIRKQVNKIDELDKTALRTEAEASSVEQQSNTRVYVIFENINQNYIFSAAPLNNNFQVAYLGYNGSTIVDSSGWTAGFIDYVPTANLITKVIINVRKVGDVALTVEEAIQNITYSCFISNISTVEYINGFISSDYSHSYVGEVVRINKTFDIVGNGSYPATATPMQGMAIYGQYCVQGTSTESDGKTKSQLLDLDNRTLIADLLLSHDGYSAIHCNTMCFGAETANGGIIPALYVSQWNNQKCCFVYDITTTDATLLQVIDPSQLTKDGVRFGLGYVDWVVDTEHGWLFALSYKGTNYSVGQIITKFALPALSDGSVVSLTDADIIDSSYLGNYIIRQDGCYHDNKLYLLFGSTSSYAQYLAVHVIDVFTLQEVTTIPLQFVDKEPEGIDVYNGDLAIHFANEGTLKKFVFS